MTDALAIFAGTANPDLARKVARELGVRLGARQVGRFPDGETSVRLDEPVRGREVFIVQPTSPPVNDHLVELLAFADACRRASAARTTAIVPYFGYARSDKRGGHTPVHVGRLAERSMLKVVRGADDDLSRSNRSGKTVGGATH